MIISLTNIRTILGLGLTLAVAACSGGPADPASEGPGLDGENAADAPATAPDDESSGEGATAAATPDESLGEGIDATTAAPGKCPTVKHGTLVVVGDSISDVSGGTPYYRTLLVDNDDAKYPAWKGADLSTCWKLDPSVDVVKVSRGGARATVPADNSANSSLVLLNQVRKIPRSLKGPVLVVGTIGGNDAQAGIANHFFGDKSALPRFIAGYGAAMKELTTPGRFGAGVKADVYITNIYDPSGGTGVYRHAPTNRKCGGVLAFWPTGVSSSSFFTTWNSAMAKETTKYPGVRLLDMHAAFKPHSLSRPAADNWFVSDCIHPSTAGHDGLRRLFWAALP